jgi:hypothetical protein
MRVRIFILFQNLTLGYITKTLNHIIFFSSNKDKFKEMPYIGHLLTAEGVKPNPEKIAAITNMEKPTDVKGVQRLLGMANYLTKFLENLSDICEPIQKLTHKENEWNWTFEQDEAFEKLKEAVTKAPVLKYFNSKMETTLQCDASELGLGAMLICKTTGRLHTLAVH